MEKLQLAPDFVEFLKLLNGNGVDYLVIGGYAVAVHGYVRTTGDLDIWVRMSPANAARVVVALREFGFSTSELDDSLFLDPDKVTRLGIPPLQIEIFTSISGVEFEQASIGRLQVALSDLEISVIGFDDLIAAKKASGRHIDLHDVDRLLGG